MRVAGMVGLLSGLAVVRKERSMRNPPMGCPLHSGFIRRGRRETQQPTRRAAFEWLAGTLCVLRATHRSRRGATAIERARENSAVRSEHRVGVMGSMRDIGQDVRRADHVGHEWIDRAMEDTRRMVAAKLQGAANAR
jgi:hypothetical protein